MTVLRNGRWKLILRDFRWQGKDFSKLEFYDLSTDPEERSDLRKEKPSVALDLSKTMREIEAESRTLLELCSGSSPLVATGDETRARLRALGYLE